MMEDTAIDILDEISAVGREEIIGEGQKAEPGASDRNDIKRCMVTRRCLKPGCPKLFNVEEDSLQRYCSQEHAPKVMDYDEVERITTPLITRPLSKEARRTIARSAKGIRDILFEEIEELRAGKSDASRLHAICKASSVILQTSAFEIKAAELGYSTETLDVERLSAE